MPFLPFIINTDKAVLPPPFRHYQSDPQVLLQNENYRLPTFFVRALITAIASSSELNILFMFTRFCASLS